MKFIKAVPFVLGAILVFVASCSKAPDDQLVSGRGLAPYADSREFTQTPAPSATPVPTPTPRNKAKVYQYPTIYPGNVAALTQKDTFDPVDCAAIRPQATLPFCTPELRRAYLVWKENAWVYQMIVEKNFGHSSDSLAAGLVACIVEARNPSRLPQPGAYYDFILPRLAPSMLNGTPRTKWADDRRTAARLFLCPDAFDNSFIAPELTLPKGTGAAGNAPAPVA